MLLYSSTRIHPRRKACMTHAHLSSGLRMPPPKHGSNMKSIPQQMGTQGLLARPCYLPRSWVLHSRRHSPSSRAPSLQTRAIDRKMSLAAVTESHGLTAKRNDVVSFVAKTHPWTALMFTSTDTAFNHWLSAQAPGVETDKNGLQRLQLQKAGWNFWTWKGNKVHYIKAGEGILQEVQRWHTSRISIDARVMHFFHTQVKLVRQYS